MGLTDERLVGMILVQAAAVGMLGDCLGVGLAGAFGLAARNTELAFYTPWQLPPITGVAVVLIRMFASLLCLRRVIALEPAIVFRG